MGTQVPKPNMGVRPKGSTLAKAKDFERRSAQCMDEIASELKKLRDGLGKGKHLPKGALVGYTMQL